MPAFAFFSALDAVAPRPQPTCGWSGTVSFSGQKSEAVRPGAALPCNSVWLLGGMRIPPPGLRPFEPHTRICAYIMPDRHEKHSPPFYGTLPICSSTTPSQMFYQVMQSFLYCTVMPAKSGLAAGGLRSSDCSACSTTLATNRLRTGLLSAGITYQGA